MKEENLDSEISIKCGKTTDSFDTLEKLCNEKAEKLLATIEIPDRKTISIAFWTADFPELIGVGIFSRNESGAIVYELDFSESTL